MADDFLIRMIQKRLVDPHYEITIEEIAKATVSLTTRMEIAQAYLRSIMNEKDLLDKFIEELKKNGRISKEFPDYVDS